MKREINPQESNRVEAFGMWISSPMPMVTNRDYLMLIARAANQCKSIFLEDHMVIGTSAMIQTELDCIVNQYTDQFTSERLQQTFSEGGAQEIYQEVKAKGDP